MARFSGGWDVDNLTNTAKTASCGTEIDVLFEIVDESPAVRSPRRRDGLCPNQHHHFAKATVLPRLN
jgi:hypothetical protein